MQSAEQLFGEIKMKKTMEMVHGVLDRRSVSAELVSRRLEAPLNTLTQNNVFILTIIKPKL